MRRRARFLPAVVPAVAATVALALLLGACNEPAAGDDTLEAGKQRVRELVVEAARILPGGEWDPPTFVGEVTCRRTFAGYAVGSTGDRRAEVPVIVALPDGTWAPDRLATIERLWRERGYEIDGSDRDHHRFPKVRATVDGYLVVATAFTERPQLNLYAVSACLRRS